MKNIFNLFLCFAFLSVFSFCDNDEPEEGFLELRYDAENYNAPSLPASTYEAAIMFPGNYDGNDEGNKIVSIDYYIQEKPQTARLKIYLGGISSPDSLIYLENVTSDISANTLNTHTLTDPLTLTGTENVWLALEFSQNAFAAVIGCDEGPAQTNGDWMYDAADETFTPFKNRPGNVDINWNIRALVEIKQ